jgi:hypothetical protein
MFNIYPKFCPVSNDRFNLIIHIGSEGVNLQYQFKFTRKEELIRIHRKTGLVSSNSVANNKKHDRSDKKSENGDYELYDMSQNCYEVLEEVEDITDSDVKTITIQQPSHILHRIKHHIQKKMDKKIKVVRGRLKIGYVNMNHKLYSEDNISIDSQMEELGKDIDCITDGIEDSNSDHAASNYYLVDDDNRLIDYSEVKKMIYRHEVIHTGQNLMDVKKYPNGIMEFIYKVIYTGYNKPYILKILSKLTNVIITYVNDAYLYENNNSNYMNY